MWKKSSLILILLTVLLLKDLVASGWERILPPPRDRALCVKPVPGAGGTDTVYVGMGMYYGERGAGLWKSVDGGETWTLMSGGPQGIPENSHITRIEIDASDHQHIVAGSYKGVYITYDGGETWRFRGPQGVLDSVSALLIDSVNPSTYFVGFPYSAFFRTTDDGETWEEKIHLYISHDVVQDPVDPALLYAEVQSRIYASEDFGETWETRSLFAAADLAFEPAHPHNLLAAAYNGVFRSTDHGVSWVPTGPNTPAAGVIMAESDSLMLVGGNGLFRSTDQGTSWTEIGYLFRDAAIGEIAPDLRLPGRIWLASAFKGLHRSDDSGISWTETVIGADTAAVYTLALPAWDPTVLFAGAYQQLARTSDLGEVWHAHGGSPPGSELYYFKLSFHPEDSLLALLGTDTPFGAGVVGRSEDGGRSWSWVLVENEPYTIADVCFHPARPETAFAVFPPFCYRSTNTGLDWELFDVDPTLGGFGYLFDPYDPDRIFIYGWNSSGGTTIYRSTDGSASWMPSDTGLPAGQNVVAMYPAPSRQNTFYLALAGSSGPVYRSMDGGVTWSYVGDICYSGCGVRDILVHPRDWDILYAVTARGVYISRDGGLIWENYNEGIDTGAEFSSILVDSTVRHKVYVGGAINWAGSVWLYHRDLEPVSIGNNDGEHIGVLPREFQLSQNYPNPFNPSTTIKFDIPGAEGSKQPVRLVVYDLRGRLVRTLLDSTLEPGSHSIIWDGKNEQGNRLSSGIYLYTLTNVERSGTRKMILVE